MRTASQSVNASATMARTAYLEHFPEQYGPPERIAIARLPLTIGRAEDNDHRLYACAVSKHHAVLVRDDMGYVLRDLGSTNGTFVNGARVTERVLADGDIVHFGPLEFCFRDSSSNTGLDDNAGDVGATQALALTVPHSVIQGTQRLRELISHRAAEIVYQPIVDLRTRAVVAYEALGRGRHPALSRSPLGLFGLADECGLAVELSVLLRAMAVEQAAALPDGVKLFLNIHPRELLDADGKLLASLRALQAQPHRHDLVLEIPEASVTNVPAMGRTKESFAALGFQFAYDDFGAGQARLLELTDVPPHYLKLDIHVIQGIEALQPRQDLVKAVLGVAHTLGVQVIAEGVETEACAQTCLELGCNLGQGFLFGWPGPIVSHGG